MNRALSVLGLLACALGSVLAAIITTLVTPLYWDATLVPLAVVLAIAANVAFPILVRELGLSPLGSALPFVLWLVTVVGLGTSRPEGDVLLPAGSGAQPWVTYGMLAGGTLAGGITLARMGMPRPPQPADEPTSGPAKDGPAKDGPAKDGPAKDGPAKDGPAKDGPTRRVGTRERR
jgi:hypothetical protein